jgi:hypothetical protein
MFPTNKTKTITAAATGQPQPGAPTSSNSSSTQPPKMKTLAFGDLQPSEWLLGEGSEKGFIALLSEQMPNGWLANVSAASRLDALISFHGYTSSNDPAYFDSLVASLKSKDADTVTMFDDLIANMTEMKSTAKNQKHANMLITTAITLCMLKKRLDQNAQSVDDFRPGVAAIVKYFDAWAWPEQSTAPLLSPRTKLNGKDAESAKKVKKAEKTGNSSKLFKSVRSRSMEFFAPKEKLPTKEQLIDKESFVAHGKDWSESSKAWRAMGWESSTSEAVDHHDSWNA